VAELFPEYSRSRLTEWIKAGDVLLDGAQVRPRDPLRGGEVVTLNVVLETQTDAQPEDIPLDVLFEDEHLLVINKPVGLVVHPAPATTAAPGQRAAVPRPVGGGAAARGHRAPPGQGHQRRDGGGQDPGSADRAGRAAGRT
jgi:hypothetical protein